MSEHNGRTAGVGPGRVLGRSVSHLGSDIITLVELQTALFQVDLRDWSRGMVKAAIALVAALAFLLASTPILFISLGYVINETTELSLSASMLIAAACGLLVAGVSAVIGVWMLKRDQSVFHRFKGELKQNVDWLKQMLKNPSDVDSVRVP
jgi:uncharacterized membrane protein YqjE